MILTKYYKHMISERATTLIYASVKNKAIWNTTAKHKIGPQVRKILIYAPPKIVIRVLYFTVVKYLYTPHEIDIVTK